MIDIEEVAPTVPTRKIEGRKIITVIVYVALLLDNVLLTVIGINRLFLCIAFSSVLLF